MHDSAEVSRRFRKRADDFVGAYTGLVGVGADRLDQEPALSGRQLGRCNGICLRAYECVDQLAVDPFDGCRVQFEQCGNRVSSGQVVDEAGHDEGLRGGQRHEVDSRLENGDERAFGTDERPDEVEAAFWQEGIERVARHAAGELRERGPKELSMFGRERMDPGDDSSTGTSTSRVAPRHPEPRAVIEQHIERPDAVVGPAGRHRVGPAGVVGDHSADGAASVGGRIGPDREAESGGGLVDAVEHDAGIDRCRPGHRVDGENAMEMARRVDDHAGTGRIAGDARAASAQRHREVMLAAQCDDGDKIVDVKRCDDDGGNVAVIRGVGREEAARGGRSVDCAADAAGRSGNEEGNVVHWLGPHALTVARRPTLCGSGCGCGPPGAGRVLFPGSWRHEHRPVRSRRHPDHGRGCIRGEHIAGMHRRREGPQEVPGEQLAVPAVVACSLGRERP